MIILGRTESSTLGRLSNFREKRNHQFQNACYICGLCKSYLKITKLLWGRTCYLHHYACTETSSDSLVHNYRLHYLCQMLLCFPSAACCYKKHACAQLLSHVQLFATLWTVACQAPHSMEFFQARMLEWVAISFSRGSSWPKDWTHVSFVSDYIRNNTL